MQTTYLECSATSSASVSEVELGRTPSEGRVVPLRWGKCARKLARSSSLGFCEFDLREKRR